MSLSESIQPQEEWDLKIRPQRSWWDLRLGELWPYRYLLSLLVWRDFVSMHKQTILGSLWYVIQPVLTTVVFTIIFDRVARLPTDGLPPFLFYMAGQTIWSYFSSCLNGTSNIFAANAGIFGKVYFPRLIVPFSILISSLVSFGIRLFVFLGFVVYFVLSGSDIRPNIYILFLPVLIIIMAGIGLGMGIIVSALTTKYRDLQQLLGFGTQLLMYASPIIYPISTAPENWRWVLYINPLTAVIEMFRKAFLGTSSLQPIYLLYSFGFMVVILLIGLLIFNRAEATFMDTV